MAKVEVQPQFFADRIEFDPFGGCWLWSMTSIPSGRGKPYGRFTVKSRSKWISGLAHRASYQAHKGKIPRGMNVLHKCDVPQCVNPDHLFIGTQGDNVADMWNKGRGSSPPICHHRNELGQWAKEPK